jgi:hypothetical protein
MLFAFRSTLVEGVGQTAKRRGAVRDDGGGNDQRDGYGEDMYAPMVTTYWSRALCGITLSMQ